MAYRDPYVDGYTAEGSNTRINRAGGSCARSKAVGAAPSGSPGTSSRAVANYSRL
jgi:hypothetical protein